MMTTRHPLLTDKPIVEDSQDRLGYRNYADAVARLIELPETDTPLTIAISGPWGCGKTSLANMIKRRLIDWPSEEGEKPHVVCVFDAWLHDDTEHLGAALAAHLARTIDNHRSMLDQIRWPLPASMLRIQQRWRRKMTLVAAALIPAIVVLLIPGFQQLLDAARGVASEGVPFWQAAPWATGSAFAITAAVLAAWRQVTLFGQDAAAFVKDPRSEAARGSMGEVQDQLAKLASQVNKQRRTRRIVIFVDNLERCEPVRALDVCEVATQLLAIDGIIVVILAEMSAVAGAAEIKYSEHMQQLSQAGRNMSDGTYGRLFLQKLIQIQLDLPPPSTDQVKALFQ